jgi:hypothetical protein
MPKNALTSMLLAAAIVCEPVAAHQAETLQPPENCENAPADAVLELPAPAGYWMRIVCTETGHALAPASGDAWEIHQDARWAGIPAAGSEAGGSNDWYFIKAAVKETTGTDDVWAQQLFERQAGFPVPGGVRQTYALDVTDNRGNISRVYVFLGEDGPVAGVACLRSCESTVTVTVTHAEMGTPLE